MLQQQIEKQRPQAMPGQLEPLALLPDALRPTNGMSITVKAFRFVGNELVTDDRLAPALEPYLHRPLDFAGLQAAAAAITDAYQRIGLLASAYLPKQEITDGHVTLQIVEARFGQVRFDGDVPDRLLIQQAQAIISAALPSGQPFHINKLDRSLLVLDDLPRVAATGRLAPGSGQAETDLVLKLTDEPLLNGEVGLDNTGSRSSGRERLTANVFLNSPLKLGDQLVANLIHSRGSDYGRFVFSLPVGHDGLRIGVNASRLDYDVITPEFKSANINGKSTTWGFDAQYPFIRSRTQNLYLNAAYDDKAFNNEASGAITTRYGLRNLTLGLLGNRFDKWGGGGANFASLNLTAGDVDLDGSPNQADDATTTQTHGSFTKLRYALSRQQALTPDLSIYALFTGQFASRNLDSSEKFYLGGANGVRAYPANEGGGSQGTMLNLELRWRILNNLVVTGFYDWGSVKVNRNSNFAGAQVQNRFDLDGLGAAVAWVGQGGLTLKGTYARRLGNNPNQDATTGKDQDGTLVKNRFWLTATLPF